MRPREQSVGRAAALPWIRAEVERFGAYLRAEKRSESTVEQYAKTLSWFFEWFEKEPDALTDEDMQRWKEYLAVQKDYCENTMSTRIAAVNQYTERILKRPELKMRPPRRVIRTKIPLTEDEVKRIMAEAREPRAGRKGFRTESDMSRRDYAAICLMYYGGLRASEVASLRVSDLDLDNKKLRVHEGKGMDCSLVNLSDEAVNGLRDYLAHGRPTPSKPECADRVFLSATGAMIGRGKLWPMVKRIAFRAGIEKNVHPHIFRHSMITHMAEKGLSASFIQAQSRHKSLDMVQRYTHLSEKSVRDSYDLVFAKKPAPRKTAEPEVPECAQTQGNAPARAERTDTSSEGDLKERALKLFLDGMLSDEQLCRVEKLFSKLDGPRQKTPPIVAGYV